MLPFDLVELPIDLGLHLGLHAINYKYLACH